MNYKFIVKKSLLTESYSSSAQLLEKIANIELVRSQMMRILQTQMTPFEGVC